MIFGSYNHFFITSIVVIAVKVDIYNHYFITSIVVGVIVGSYNHYFITPIVVIVVIVVVTISILSHL